MGLYIIKKFEFGKEVEALPTDIGTNYSPFTNTVDGLVPAPNVSGTTTYSGVITSPAQGFTITEGVLVTVTASESSMVIPASVDVRYLSDEFDGNTGKGKWKDVDILTSPNGTLYKLSVTDNGTLITTVI